MLVALKIGFETLLETVSKRPSEQKARIPTGLGSAPLVTMPDQALSGKRIAGLGEGTMWLSDDFDAPLPDVP